LGRKRRHVSGDAQKKRKKAFLLREGKRGGRPSHFEKE